MKRLTLLAATIFAGPALAQTAVPISSLPTASDTFDGTEYVAGIQQGISRKFPLSKTLNAGHIKFTPTGAPADTDVATQLARTVFIDSYKAPSDSNDCYALQQAVTNNPHTIIKFSPRAYTLGASCNIQLSDWVQIEGTDWSDHSTTAGTVLNITNTSSSLFALSGGGTAGFALRRVKIVQPQPTPALGWTPTVYPPVVACTNSAGQITIDDVQMQPVYDLVSAAGCGRLHVRNIKGDALHRVVTADTSYDSDRYEDWHIWPYWGSTFTATQLAYVQAWTQANLVPLQLGRVDTPFLDRLFVISAKAAVQFSNLGNGVTTRYHFGKIQADGSKYGILWDASAQATRGQIDQIDVEHTDQSATTLTGSHASITNSASLTFEGFSTNHRVQIGSLASEWAANNIINDVGGSNIVDIGPAHIDRWGSRTGSDYAVYTSGSSQITLGQVTTINFTSPNYIDPTKDSVCYSRVESGVAKRYCSNGAKPTFSTLAVQAATPTFALLGTSQGTDRKNWDWLADASGNLCTRAVNDAYGAAANALCFNRTSGAGVASTDAYAPAFRFINNGTPATNGVWMEADNSTAGYPTLVCKTNGTPSTALSGCIISGGAAGAATPLSLRSQKLTAGWGVLATNEFVSETDGGNNIGSPGYGRPDKVYVKTAAIAPVHLSTVAAPAQTSCGTDSSVDAGSTAQAGKFTIGTGATACTLTFSVAYPTNAYCTVTPVAQPAAVANIPYISAQSRTAFTMSGGTASASYYYSCGGN